MACVWFVLGLYIDAHADKLMPVYNKHNINWLCKQVAEADAINDAPLCGIYNDVSSQFIEWNTHRSF